MIKKRIKLLNKYLFFINLQLMSFSFYDKPVGIQLSGVSDGRTSTLTIINFKYSY